MVLRGAVTAPGTIWQAEVSDRNVTAELDEEKRQA